MAQQSGESSTLAITFEHSIFTFEAVPGNDISVSLNGEKSWDDMESLLDRPGDGEQGLTGRGF